jgi:hypothetical protein
VAIHIIKEPDVHISAGDLARYQAEYKKTMQYYFGPPITLEEFIRSRQEIGRDLAAKLIDG